MHQLTITRFAIPSLLLFRLGKLTEKNQQNANEKKKKHTHTFFFFENRVRVQRGVKFIAGRNESLTGRLRARYCREGEVQKKGNPYNFSPFTPSLSFSSYTESSRTRIQANNRTRTLIGYLTCPPQEIGPSAVK